MARQRLGKAERAIVRAWHQERRARIEAVVKDNLSRPKPAREVFSTVKLNRVVIAPYKGAYDSTFSTERNHRGYTQDKSGAYIPRPFPHLKEK